MCSGSGIQRVLDLVWKHPDPRLNISDPLEVLDYCRAYTTRLLLRHEYVVHDFLVYMYRP